jgi:hypothetical protein
VTSQDQLKSTCEALVKAAQGMLRWEWDGRFGAALSVFTKAESAQVLAVVKGALPMSWDARTIGSAPELVRACAKALGGLQGGQLAFATGNDAAAVVFAAWWPWGNGENISLRISAACAGLAADAEEQLERQVRQWFGLS